MENSVDRSEVALLPKADLRVVVGSIIAISIVAVIFLFWLIYFKPTPDAYADSLAFLPALNAALNFASASAMCVGLHHIRRREWRKHKRFMLLALLFSSIFLVSYILNYSLRDDTKFAGAGTIRYVYFFILASHVLLSIVALPMVLTTFYLSLSGRLALHKKLARITFPVWLYVSITGVIVYFMLHHTARFVAG